MGKCSFDLMDPLNRMEEWAVDVVINIGRNSFINENNHTADGFL